MISPRFLNALASAGKSTAKAAWNSGTFSRMAIGAAAGGIYGAATSDKNNPTGIFGDITRGAIAGAAIGGATKLPAAIWRNKETLGPIAGKAGWGIMKNLGKLGAEAGMFAMEHPYATTAVVGAGLYLNQDRTPYYSMMNDNTTQLRTNVSMEPEQTNRLQESLPGQVIPSSTIRNQNFADSTQGLVMGLWRRRH
jgi:hypothetical protein